MSFYNVQFWGTIYALTRALAKLHDVRGMDSAKTIRSQYLGGL